MVYRYRSAIRTLIQYHGVHPRASTPPDLIREFLNSLYVFEIRELRRQRREVEEIFGTQPLDGYSKQVQELKDRYPVLAIPVSHWTEPQS